MLKLKVHVDPPPHMSQAMFRVARALKQYAPEGVQFVPKHDADFRVLHVIAADAIPYVEERPDLEYAVIQYCYSAIHHIDGSNKESGVDWSPLWNRAATVWSYYDLPTDKLYLTPLGIDSTFRSDYPITARGIGVMTSGYVSGPGAEAIEEVYLAADRTGLSTVHLGPMPEGFSQQPDDNWRTINGVSDLMLANHYRHAKYVSGLRHIEGFEMPVIEGLACGARPIVFDREDMHRWYDEHAIFVPECHGVELVNHLVKVFLQDPRPVEAAERAQVLTRFDWEPIIKGFWERAL